MKKNNTFYDYIWKKIQGNNNVPDIIYLKIQYRVRLGKTLHYLFPKDFNEKIQWIKLFNRNPLMVNCADKYQVKDWVCGKCQNVKVAKTYHVYENADEIDLNELPDRFVLKCTHDTGSTVICRNKKKFDLTNVRKRLDDALKSNLYYAGREWCYKDIPPRIMAEEYIEAPNDDLYDYKFFCFNGEPRVIQVNYNRVNGNPILKFYDLEWNELNVKLIYDNEPYKKCDRPILLDEMISISKKLSDSFKFVRVDLYVSNNNIYCGELTFYPNCGFGKFEPDNFDRTLGDYLKL